MVNEHLRGLSGLTTTELVRRLRRYIASAETPISPSELILAQELLRRARQCAAVQLQLQQSQGPRPFSA
jgi:hypothetical protein